MIPIQRQSEPKSLEEKTETWTHNYLKRLKNYEVQKSLWDQGKSDKKPSTPKFVWPQYQKKKLNQHLLPILSQMTADHCSYCDGFPMGVESEDNDQIRGVMTARTIDHFRPKETFPEKAFAWNNLFLCCSACQETKGTQFEEALLAPDHPDYQFEDFFLVNFHTGDIDINPFAPEENRNRARITLKILKLNEGYLPTYRRNILEDQAQNQRPINERPYRFMFSA